MDFHSQRLGGNEINIDWFCHFEKLGQNNSNVDDDDDNGASPAPDAVGVYDHLWISASTCFHQCKVPHYSSAAVMAAALADAIAMSQGLIDLS